MKAIEGYIILRQQSTFKCIFLKKMLDYATHMLPV